ncbi:major facilitator superfamily domain-containing protein [Aspergillus cavernicola]|uniref:Major facilitator superfamily domain-containing protein n=1 Tax=Aspergillus cavernicola TaxID=176166 RepID=A0ABR4HU80_9EURO
MSESAPPVTKSTSDERIEFATPIPSQPASDPERNSDGHKKDKALEVIEDVGHSTILTPENNKRVLRRIDLRILPILLGIYFLQQLDKSTLSYGSVFGLIEDADLKGQEYSWLGSSIYLVQLVAQPAVAYILVKVRLAKFLAVMVFFWGISLTCMTPAQSFGGLLACRIFLGVFEAGIPPAFIAITQMWYRRREQPMRLSSWYAMNGVVNMFGSLIAFGLGHIKSSLAPYQIIFLVFGLVTVAFSVVVVNRLRMNQQGIETDEWKWAHVKEAFMDPKSFFWFALMFSISIPSGGITTFGPLIIESFGFDQLKTMLFNIPFGAIQLVATLGGAWLATKYKTKGGVIALLCLPAITGCVMLLQIPRGDSHKGPLLAGYYIISVYPAITPMIYSWAAGNTAGETKKKVINGILLVGQCAGNVVGPNLYTTEEAPGYRRGLLSNLAMFCVLLVLSALNLVYIFYLNQQHGKRRVAMGKSATIIDRSMQEVGEPELDKAEDGRMTEEDNAFKDLTDFENEDFVYVY